MAERLLRHRVKLHGCLLVALQTDLHLQLMTVSVSEYYPELSFAFSLVNDGLMGRALTLRE